MEVISIHDSANKKTQRSVDVHVTFIKVGEINTLKEVFDADVLLRTKWREPLLDNHARGFETEDVIDWREYWNPKVYIDNAVVEPRQTSSCKLELNIQGEAYVVERKRMKGTFMETMELWEFPFDVQDLTVTIMADAPSTEVVLVEDPEEIHRIFKRSFIDEQEWYLYKYIESERKELAKDRADPTVRRSALHVRCRAARRPWYFVWNSFSVMMLITCLAFMTFAVTTEKPENRLQLTFTLVLTSVAFKFVVNQSLPKISYLTYLDRYILASLITLSIICFWHGLQTVLPKTTPNGETVDILALVVVAGLYILYNVQFIMRIIAVPYRRRREMKRREAQYEETVKETALKQSKRKGKKRYSAV